MNFPNFSLKMTAGRSKKKNTKLIRPPKIDVKFSRQILAWQQKTAK
jgi:hypothetical protein